MAMPDGVRLNKVKTTMARIKTVLGERQRATEALLHARGEYRPPQQPEWEGEPVTIKKYGRKYTVPSDHPWAMRPTRAERMTSNRIARSLHRWQRKLVARKRSRKGVPEDVVQWMAEQDKMPLEESAMEAARVEQDTRFDGESRGGPLEDPYAGKGGGGSGTSER